MIPPEGHDFYFHVRILIGLVLGLGLTRILSGVSRIVQQPSHKKLYATHLLWVAVVLVSAIHFWWFEFGLIRIGTWRFELFAFVLFYAFLFYLMASLLFPDEMSDFASYEDYYFSRRRWFFGLLAATVPIDIVDTLAKGRAYFDGLGPEYPLQQAALLMLCAVAAWTENRRLHFALAALYLLYLISWILRVYDVLA
jgi:hypothetical protein